MRQLVRLLPAVGLGAVLCACAARPVPIADWSAALPPDPVQPVAAPTNGAIYQDGMSIVLFEDVKARQVGDTITIQLVERTTASTSASTNTQRNTGAEIANPVVFGRSPTRGGVPLFQGSMNSEQQFNGEGNSNQSNRIDGNITVTVHQRLSNGNLLVRGEKWIQVNQGREYLRVSGIVRPADIGPNNIVLSSRVADARIEYGGRGAIADANRQGWLARFFQSPWTPF